VSIEGNTRWVARHLVLKSNQRVLAYVAERVRHDGDHLIWTGQRHEEDGRPLGRMIVERGGKPTRFDPRLILWTESALDDAVMILPGCGKRLCLAHLVAVPWVALGPE
jgi:hypothetical protein